MNRCGSECKRAAEMMVEQENDYFVMAGKRLRFPNFKLSKVTQALSTSAHQGTRNLGQGKTWGCHAYFSLSYGILLAEQNGKQSYDLCLMWTHIHYSKFFVLIVWSVWGRQGVTISWAYGLSILNLGCDRGWDGWVASLIQWPWTWANSRRWWGAGEACVL